MTNYNHCNDYVALSETPKYAEIEGSDLHMTLSSRLIDVEETCKPEIKEMLKTAKREGSICEHHSFVAGRLILEHSSNFKVRFETPKSAVTEHSATVTCCGCNVEFSVDTDELDAAVNIAKAQVIMECECPKR